MSSNDSTDSKVKNFDTIFRLIVIVLVLLVFFFIFCLLPIYADYLEKPRMEYRYNDQLNIDTFALDGDFRSIKMRLHPQIVITYKDKIVLVIYIKNYYNNEDVLLNENIGSAEKKYSYTPDISVQHKFVQHTKDAIINKLNQYYNTSQVNEIEKDLSVDFSILSGVTYENKKGNKEKQLCIIIENNGSIKDFAPSSQTIQQRLFETSVNYYTDDDFMSINKKFTDSIAYAEQVISDLYKSGKRNNQYTSEYGPSQTKLEEIFDDYIDESQLYIFEKLHIDNAYLNNTDFEAMIIACDEKFSQIYKNGNNPSLVYISQRDKNYYYYFNTEYINSSERNRPDEQNPRQDLVFLFGKDLNNEILEGKMLPFEITLEVAANSIYALETFLAYNYRNAGTDIAPIMHDVDYISYLNGKAYYSMALDISSTAEPYRNYFFVAAYLCFEKGLSQVDNQSCYYAALLYNKGLALEKMLKIMRENDNVNNEFYKTKCSECIICYKEALNLVQQEPNFYVQELNNILDNSPKSINTVSQWLKEIS